MRVDDVTELAAMMRATWDLGLPCGISVANPVPAAEELAHSEVDAIIETALAECEAQGVRGKAITPFLLRRLVELSDGRSLQANLALVRNNARLGAALAVAWAAAPSAPVVAAPFSPHP